MNCRQFLSILDEYSENTLSDQDSQSAAQHCAECASCREELNNYRLFLGRLRSRDGFECPSDVTLRILADVESAEKSSRPLISSLPGIMNRHRWSIGLAAAAFILAFVAGSLITSFRRARPIGNGAVYSQKDITRADHEVRMTLSRLYRLTDKTSRVIENDVLSKGVYQPLSNSLNKALTPRKQPSVQGEQQ